MLGAAALQHIFDAGLGRAHAGAVELAEMVEHLGVLDDDLRARLALDGEGDIAAGVLAEIVDRAQLAIGEGADDW